jgi:hypothetical protein
VNIHEWVEKELGPDFRREKRAPVTIEVDGHKFAFTVGSMREFHEADELAMEIYLFMEEMEREGSVPTFRLLHGSGRPLEN